MFRLNFRSLTLPTRTNHRRSNHDFNLMVGAKINWKNKFVLCLFSRTSFSHQRLQPFRSFSPQAIRPKSGHSVYSERTRFAADIKVFRRYRWPSVWISDSWSRPNCFCTLVSDFRGWQIDSRSIQCLCKWSLVCPEITSKIKRSFLKCLRIWMFPICYAISICFVSNSYLLWTYDVYRFRSGTNRVPIFLYELIFSSS